MTENVTIEPMSRTYFSSNPQKRPSINYSTTIPLEIPWEEAWEIIKEIIARCFPNDNVRLEAVSADLALDRYCFSISGHITPEALDVPVEV